MATMTLSPADNGKSVTVRAGDTLTLQLDEIPTTGFRWAVDQSNPDLVALQRTDYFPAPATGVGGGGRRVFVFQAKKAGTGRLALKLWRDWEGERSVTQRFEITLGVKDGGTSVGP
jgi:inhibitor of cysteine peptidase